MTSLELSVLSDAHARVDMMRVHRLKAQSSCLDEFVCAEAKKTLASARARAATLRAAAQLGADTRAAAQLLNVALERPSAPDPLTVEDVALAAALARVRLANAAGAAGEAQLELDAALAAWPPDKTRAGEACAERADSSSRAVALLTRFAASADTTVARDALAAATRPYTLTAAAEAAARASCRHVQMCSPPSRGSRRACPRTRTHAIS
eukprot:gnl/Chilomastix_cuspidata/3354.p2 GENE.gnl/Chilomastix_cuspidata/3354~~gnl/Chilomastix_cuspidata/3354.p2  ORF type:complete len:209 (-),score=41.69 gnl/Chilomastix_cuspidata/3354:285-911(-)